MEFVFLIISGAIHFTASNNDCGVRDFDMEKYQLSRHFRFPWPVNVSHLSYTQFGDQMCYFFHFEPISFNQQIPGQWTLCTDDPPNECHSYFQIV